MGRKSDSDSDSDSDRQRERRASEAASPPLPERATVVRAVRAVRVVRVVLWRRRALVGYGLGCALQALDVAMRPIVSQEVERGFRENHFQFASFALPNNTQRTKRASEERHACGSLSVNGVATTAAAAASRRGAASPCILHPSSALPRVRPGSRDDSRSLAVRRASSRDVEDQPPSSELFDNGEAPSSQERESVAARLRRRRMQMRAEASGSGVGGVSSGVRRRRRRFEGVPVLDTEYEDEDGNFYDVDAEVVYGGYDDEALVGGRGEEDGGG